MNKTLKLYIFIVFFSIISVQIITITLLYGTEGLRECLIKTKSCSFDELKDIIYFIEEQGGQAYHIFPPTIIQASINSQIETTLLKRGIAKIISNNAYIDTAPEGKYGAVSNPGIISWNYQFRPRLKGIFDQGGRIYDDVIFPPEEEIRIRGLDPRKRTSAYMAGTCAVSIVFVECNGQRETPSGLWTREKKEFVISQIRNGLDWWAKEGQKKAHLTWIYEIHNVDVDREPSNHPIREDSLWIRQAIQQIYKKNPHFPYYFQCSLYAGELREKFSTDWGFIIFACENSDDLDGYFRDGGFAYAYLGGPYMVVTYKNNGWGPEQLHLTVAHEAGHIFYALDEYKKAVTGPRTSGVLNVENGNHELYGVLSEECIMKNNAKHICNYTLGQVGWWDDDNDGKFDPDETWKHPHSTIQPVPVFPKDNIYPGTLTIVTSPQKASVRLDNVFKGMSPLNLDSLKYGTHNLKIVKPGCLDYTEQFNLTKNNPITRKEITLKIIDEIETLSENLLNNNPDIMINAEIEKPSYKIGDNLYLSFNTNVECYLHLIDISSDTMVSIVFPNEYSSNNFIVANRKYSVPDEKATFDLSVTGPAGKDRLIFIATREPLKEIQNMPIKDSKSFICKLSDILKSFPKDVWASRLLYFNVEE